jgi:hypothetical protein
MCQGRGGSVEADAVGDEVRGWAGCEVVPEGVEDLSGFGEGGVLVGADGGGGPGGDVPQVGGDLGVYLGGEGGGGVGVGRGFGFRRCCCPARRMARGLVAEAACSDGVMVPAW